MTATLVTACALAGAAFTLVAALGVLRLPDVLMRMHAATKAGTLGAGLLLVAGALATPDPGHAARAVATLVFLVLTAPVAAHVIGRAAWCSRSERLHRGTRIDRSADRPQPPTPPNVDEAA